MPSALTASIEDYLEAVYVIGQDQNVVRVKDISSRLKVSMPSVNSAIKILTKGGFVDFEKYGYIQLTAKGEREASRIYGVHVRLRDFMTGILRLDPALAEEDACRLEHCISETTLLRLGEFIDFIEACKHRDPKGCPAVFAAQLDGKHKKSAP